MGKVTFTVPGPGEYAIEANPSMPALANPGAPGDLLSGKEAYDSDGRPQVGTMPNNGAVDVELTESESYTIPQGYHNGSGKVRAAMPDIPTVTVEIQANVKSEVIAYYQSLYGVFTPVLFGLNTPSERTMMISKSGFFAIIAESQRNMYTVRIPTGNASEIASPGTNTIWIFEPLSSIADNAIISMTITGG